MVTRWSQTIFDGELLRRAGRVLDEASRLSMAGRRDEAAVTGERGLRMVREIAGRDRAQALPLLVRATCDQSWYLAETARYGAALELAEEGLGLARTVDDTQLLARALPTSASRLLRCR